MFESVEKNKFGYYELIDKPSEQELSEYYSKKYFQENKGAYQKSYTEEEIEFIKNRLSRKYLGIEKNLNLDKERSFLDIGCGEGWALDFFYCKGWKVKGLDYSSYGLGYFNPQMKNYIVDGDIGANIQSLIDAEERYDVVLLDNVLEHALKPLDLIKKLANIVSEGGILIIEVPNDFSILQKYLIENGFIDSPFWVVSPDHISYFNKEGLENLLKSTGWEILFHTTDYPIDLNIINPDTNYVRDKTKGHNVHIARVKIENLFDSIDPELSFQLLSKYAEMGLGRNLISFFKPNKNKDGNF